MSKKSLTLLQGGIQILLLIFLLLPAIKENTQFGESITESGIKFATLMPLCMILIIAPVITLLVSLIFIKSKASNLIAIIATLLAVFPWIVMKMASNSEISFAVGGYLSFIGYIFTIILAVMGLMSKSKKSK